MVRTRAVGLAAFGAAALGGAVLGYLGERRVMSGRAHAAGELEAPDELLDERGWRSRDVTSADRTLLHVVEAGPAGAPAIVLVHGMGLSSAVWHHQIEKLSNRYHVVALDLRGHGESARAARGDYSLAALGADVAAVIDAVAPDVPVLLVGHSIGAMAVLSCCEHHPDIVDGRLGGVVLCNSAAGGVFGGAAGSGLAAALGTVQARLQGVLASRSWRARDRFEGDDPADRPTTDLSLLVTRQFGLNPAASPELVAFLEYQLRSTAPVVLGSYATALAGLDLAEAADSVAVPAVVIAGGRDRLTPLRQARKLVEALPDAELVEVEGAGHTVMLEAPDEVTATLASFADRVFPRPR